MRVPAYLKGVVSILGRDFPTYRLFLIGFSIATIAVLWLTLEHSRFGALIRAAVDNRRMAQSLGVNTSRAQIIALLWSAGFTGVLGVFYAQFVYIIDPDFAFSSMLFSVQPALNGIIGGMGTIWGPVLGAVLMTPLGEDLRSYLGNLQQGLSFFIYGMVLMGVVMIMPGGIVSVLAPFFKRMAPGAKIAPERKAGP